MRTHEHDRKGEFESPSPQVLIFDTAKMFSACLLLLRLLNQRFQLHSQLQNMTHLELLFCFCESACIADAPKTNSRGPWNGPGKTLGKWTHIQPSDNRNAWVPACGAGGAWLRFFTWFSTSFPHVNHETSQAALISLWRFLPFQDKSSPHNPGDRTTPEVTPLQTMLTKVELTGMNGNLELLHRRRLSFPRLHKKPVGWQCKHSLEWEKCWRIDAPLKTLNCWNGKERSQILRRFLSKVQAPFCLLASKKWL